MTEDIKIKQNFEEVYKSKIEPMIRKLEPYRLEQKKKFDFYSKIALKSLLIFLLGFFATLLLHKIGLIVYIICFVVTCIIGGITSKTANKIKDDYRKTIKQVLLKHILSCFGNFKLANYEVMSLEEIKSMGLYYNAFTKKDDDVIWGTYSNLPITLFETKLTHQSRGEHSSTITDFSGLVVKVKINKKFTGTTIASQEVTQDKKNEILERMVKAHPDLFPQVDTKTAAGRLFATLAEFQNFKTKNKLHLHNGKLFISLSNTKNKANKNLEIVRLEDPEFDNNYNVYSDDQVEARYLITPSFMERIKHIQSIFFAPSVDFAFKDGFLYLFLNSSDEILNFIKTQRVAKENKSKITLCETDGFFEVGSIQTTLFNKEIFKDIFDELSSIFSLVDYFKLNENTGL